MRTPKGEELSRLVWVILRAASGLTEAGNMLSAPFGLTSARWQVLGVIVLGPATVSEVARQLTQTRQGIQRLADELVREGFAAYAPNPRHARAKLLTPTAHGAASYEALMGQQSKWVDALAADMRQDEIVAARALLQRLETALERNAT